MKNDGIAVIGLGFGDEGKGRVVDWLSCVHAPSCIVRFSGGQQAAHHVITESGDAHVFSSYGSGTLRGVPSFIMRYCTIDPSSLLNEFFVLKNNNMHAMHEPVLRIDGRCPVTTPYDKMHNQRRDAENKHGTCGLGVGATWQREQDLYSLLAEDLQYPDVLKNKLVNIRKYYQEKGTLDSVDKGLEKIEGSFMIQCHDMLNLPFHSIGYDISKAHEAKNGPIIFEGSQGLMLDPEIGFFPHVTRSTIGLSNLVKEGYSPHVFLVTRAYQTRHGNGPMMNENKAHGIRPNPYEKNDSNGPQGKFRQSLLDVSLLKYAMMKETYIRRNPSKLSLVITCIDLVENEWRYTLDGKTVCHIDRDAFVMGIADELEIKDVFISDSPIGNIKLFNSAVEQDGTLNDRYTDFCPARVSPE